MAIDISLQDENDSIVSS